VDGVDISTHTHDDRYYTESELNTAGTINDTGNPVDWTKLKGVPTGFADGVDDTGGAGDGHSLDAADGSPTDVVYVNNDGEVNISSTTDVQALVVSGDVNYNNGLVRVDNTGSGHAIMGVSYGPGIVGVNYEEGGGYSTPGSGADIGVYGSSANGYGGYFVGEKNYFSGNVGIGTRTPNYPLHMGSGAHVTEGGVWTNASSREYKENIRDLTTEEAVVALCKLRPTKFNYKVDKEEECLGFVAEEVPDLVASKDRKGLSPMDIVALLTKVVQHQQEKIEELEARLNEVK
jgi:hypothetical protein